MAITAAAFKGYERTGNSYRVRVSITDSVAGTYEKWITVSGTTLQELTDQAAQQIQALAAADTQKDLLAGIAIDAAMPISYTAPAASADQVWLAQVASLIHAKAAQSAGLSAAQFVTDLNSLAAAVNAGYSTARGQKL